MIRALALCLPVLATPAPAQEFQGRACDLTPGSGSGPPILALHGGLGSGAQLRRDSPLEAAAATLAFWGLAPAAR